MSSDKAKKVVVTGACGFLGSNLVEALKEKEGYFVYALSSHGDKLQKSNASRNIQYCHKDAISSDGGNLILKDAIVVNCAFPRNSTGTGMADGLRYIQQLFDRSKECGTRAIINISSQSVYSQTREEPATEETPVCLESPYAVGKYMTELMLESVCKGAGIMYTNLRMASLIGPGFDQRIVNRLVKQALEGENLQVIKSNRKFGFFDVEDAVTAILTLINRDIFEWKAVYNVGGFECYTIDEIVYCIRDVFRKKKLPIPQICLEDGTGEGNTAVDYQLYHIDIGFTPTVNLSESVETIINEIIDV